MTSSEDLQQAEPSFHPWTVVALVILNVASVVGGLVAGDLSAGELLLSLLLLWITYAMWIAKTWAFTFSFMLASLCAGAFVTVGAVQILLLEQAASSGLLWPLVIAAIYIVLLMHPATKRFARLTGRPRPT